MSVSVIICTYNRCEELKRCLFSLSRQTFSLHEGEIIVIDNNSTDRTLAVVEEFHTQHPDLTIRYILEPRQGIAYARNRALQEASHPIIAFIDDDAAAAPDWLFKLLEPLSDPGICAVGGRVDLELPMAEPPWFSKDLRLQLSEYIPVKNTVYSIQENDYIPISCNLAVRLDAVQRIGGFDNFLGRKGTDHEIMGGEETRMLESMIAHGMRVVVQPEAIVTHFVPHKRLRKQYFIRLADGFAKLKLEFLKSEKLEKKLLYLVRYAFVLSYYFPRHLFQYRYFREPVKLFKKQLKFYFNVFKFKQTLKYIFIYKDSNFLHKREKTEYCLREHPHSTPTNK